MLSFSTITGTITLLALSASGGKVIFDLDSNGHYWWGAPWTHAPDNGDTGSCVCIKGCVSHRQCDAICFNGIGYDRSYYGGVYEMAYHIPFSGKYPIEITTDGHDGLWIDRVRIETDTGKRWYGANDSHGWCLSKDKNDQFDKWSTHEGCTQNISFYIRGAVYGVAAYGRNSPWLWWRNINIDTTAKCAAVKRGRRRAEGSDVMAIPTSGSTIGSDTYFDADPTGESPNQVHSEIDALVVGTLHRKIRELVRDNTDVTDAKIDSVLNSAMLDVEHFVERQEHEGELLEPEGLEFADDSEIMGSNTRNVQERLQDLEESEGEEEPLGDD